MAVDFPDNPVANDLFAAEGKTWQWLDPPKAWIVVNSEVGTIGEITIVTNDFPSDKTGHLVVGDTLFQWGVQSGVAAPQTVTFPIAFLTVPNVQCGPSSGSATEPGTTNLYSTIVWDHTLTSFDVRVNYQTTGGTSLSSQPIAWFASGEAPDNMKMPKSFSVLGASVQEFHDPLGVSSWRIVGNTLECWGGIATGASGTAVTFPKTFNNAFPRITFGVLSTTSPTTGQASFQTLSASGFYIQGWDWLSGVVNQKSLDVAWHVIGEWDGVS